jgi:hypothetical protein
MLHTMEVLFQILKEYTFAGSGFKFHFRCSKLKLTHLCFVDDHLIFSKADMSSISIIQAALLEFEQLSGLKANPAKSFFFFFFRCLFWFEVLFAG